MIIIDDEVYSILASISREKEMCVTALIDQILSDLEGPR